MPHATHFLQRLDRIDERQVELALTLYRDDDLLKTLLASVELPDAAERVAVSLGHPERGPFVVLTRTGRFVTCLAEGMRVSDLPVITRERFDIAAARLQRLREEIERIKQLQAAGGESQVKRLMRTMDTVGPRFCREDAQLLERVAPLVAPSITGRLGLMIKTVIEHLGAMAAMRIPKLSPAERDVLLSYGQLMWSVAHALPMLTVSETRHLWKLVGEDERAYNEFHFPAMAFELLMVPHGHRALWCVARSGKGGLGFARLPRRMPELPGRLAFRELALAAIAFGSPSLRAQALHKLTPVSELQQTANPAAGFGAYVAKLLRRGALNDAELAVECYTDVGREMIRACWRAADPGTSIDDAELPPIPDDIARAAAANAAVSWAGGPDAIVYLEIFALALPWLARAPLEELYLPRAWAERLIPPLSVESVAAWLKPCADTHGFGRPPTWVRTEPKPARNGACPCGSGKKWKRCCAGKPARKPAADAARPEPGAE